MMMLLLLFTPSIPPVFRGKSRLRRYSFICKGYRLSNSLGFVHWVSILWESWSQSEGSIGPSETSLLGGSCWESLRFSFDWAALASFTSAAMGNVADCILKFFCWLLLVSANGSLFPGSACDLGCCWCCCPKVGLGPFHCGPLCEGWGMYWG